MWDSFLFFVGLVGREFYFRSYYLILNRGLGNGRFYKFWCVFIICLQDLFLLVIFDILDCLFFGQFFIVYILGFLVV